MRQIRRQPSRNSDQTSAQLFDRFFTLLTDNFEQQVLYIYHGASEVLSNCERRLRCAADVQLLAQLTPVAYITAEKRAVCDSLQAHAYVGFFIYFSLIDHVSRYRVTDVFQRRILKSGITTFKNLPQNILKVCTVTFQLDLNAEKKKILESPTSM